jgi:hypothetical protein
MTDREPTLLEFFLIATMWIFIFGGPPGWVIIFFILGYLGYKQEKRENAMKKQCACNKTNTVCKECGLAMDEEKKTL